MANLKILPVALLLKVPHNGKEEDFQLFLALLDSDRFEGRFRDGVHTCDVSDLMRRLVKEDLLKFDGKPLFPERQAHFCLPVLDLTLERHRDVLRQGAILVDETDPGETPRVLVYLEHSIQDGRTGKDGQRQVAYGPRMKPPPIRAMPSRAYLTAFPPA